jgi:hypothetical protein
MFILNRFVPTTGYYVDQQEANGLLEARQRKKSENAFGIVCTFARVRSPCCRQLVHSSPARNHAAQSIPIRFYCSPLFSYQLKEIRAVIKHHGSLRSALLYLFPEVNIDPSKFGSFPNILALF